MAKASSSRSQCRGDASHCQSAKACCTPGVAHALLLLCSLGWLNLTVNPQATQTFLSFSSGPEPFQWHPASQGQSDSSRSAVQKEPEHVFLRETGGNLESLAHVFMGSTGSAHLKGKSPQSWMEKGPRWKGLSKTTDAVAKL